MVAVDGGLHILRRLRHAQTAARALKTVQTHLRHRSILRSPAVHIGDAAVPLVNHMLHQIIHTLRVIRKNRAVICKGIVDGDQRDAAVHQLPHALFLKKAAHDHHAVVAAVAAVFQIAAFQMLLRAGNGRGVIARFFEFLMDAGGYAGEMIVQPHVLAAQEKHDANGMAAAGFERSRRGVGHIAHFIGDFTDFLRRFGPDIRQAVQRLADRGNGTAAAGGDFLQRCHSNHPSTFVPFRQRRIVR